MPWKECSVMDERLRFVEKLLDGESMTDVCRELGISPVRLREIGHPGVGIRRRGRSSASGRAPSRWERAATAVFA